MVFQNTVLYFLFEFFSNYNMNNNDTFLGCVVPVHSVHHNNFDPANPIGCIENNPLVPRNCTITRPPPITRPCRSPVVLRPPLEAAPISSLTYNDELLTKVKTTSWSIFVLGLQRLCYNCSSFVSKSLNKLLDELLY